MKNTVVIINMKAGEVTSITVETKGNGEEYEYPCQPYVQHNPEIPEPKCRKAKRKNRK